LRIPQLAHQRCALSATFPKKNTSVNPATGFPMKTVLMSAGEHK
jgi:hypothetical protein